MTTSRKALAEALADLRDAEGRLVNAKANSKSASDHLFTVESRVKALRAAQGERTMMETLALVASLKDGKPPAAMAEAARCVELDLALGAVNTGHNALMAIQAEERAAEKDVAEAKAKVEKALRAVLISEAEILAANVVKLESEALTARARLAAIDALGFGRGPTSPLIAKVMADNPKYDLEIRNTEGWRLANVAREAWVAFKAKLESDASAALRFAS